MAEMKELYEEIGRLHIKTNELSEAEDRWFKRYQEVAKERDELVAENKKLQEEKAANAWYINDLKSQIEELKHDKEVVEAEAIVDARREEEILNGDEF